MGTAELAPLRERLAAPALAPADLFACAEEIAALAASGNPSVRVGLAGDLTLDFLQRAIACALVQEGELPVLHAAPFGSLRQACLDPGSSLHAFDPDLVVLVPDARSLPLLPDEAGADQAQAWVRSRSEEFEAIWSALLRTGARIVQHLFVLPEHPGRGVAGRRLAGSAWRRVTALNQALVEAAAGRVAWVEADRFADAMGRAAFAPARFHHAGRLPFDPRFLPAYLPWFRAAWRIAAARAKKVLVLDLDDTLWGGVIGDDGLAGIALGPDHGPRGEAFAGWQLHLRELAAQGVTLAVCSKNDPAVAASAFEHPASVLKPGDFAAFVCSWNDKASGLCQVAGQIGVGLDTLVFADDNPAECALVRQLLPEVEVVELGADPAQFIARLEAGHWFDADAVTPADLQRAASYAARAQARAAETAAPDLESYLRGLAMHGRLAPARPEDLPRLAQLEARTNQFNLTTRRTSQAQLAAWLQDGSCTVLALHLRDRFADHGLVGALVAVREGEALRIESWVLSCRVFSRTAEQFMLAGLMRLAREQGASELRGEYIATPRNSVVADLFARLGFAAPCETSPWWRMPLDGAAEPASFIAPGDA